MTRDASYPKPATLAAVVRKGRVLLIRRAHMPDAERWAFPGGKIEPGETLTAASARELAEETGVLATPGDVFDAVDVIDADHNLHYVLIAVLCRWERGEPVPDDDALEAAWFTLEEMAAIPVAETFNVRAIAQTALELERKQQEHSRSQNAHLPDST
ncbi:NUDIX hydrolase [Brachybacterium alimentarium]|uniref:NUDIX hydrolase n=1 Tax=Brachybacterium alimentarium TaxID=47845 RepID=UPI003FCEF929